MGLSPPPQPSPFKGEGVVVMITFINTLSIGELDWVRWIPEFFEQLHKIDIFS